jgi:hypothetical protein
MQIVMWHSKWVRVLLNSHLLSIQKSFMNFWQFYYSTVTLVLEIANVSIRDVIFTWYSKANGYCDVTFCYNLDRYSTSNPWTSGGMMICLLPGIINKPGYSSHPRTQSDRCILPLVCSHPITTLFYFIHAHYILPASVANTQLIFQHLRIDTSHQ